MLITSIKKNLSNESPILVVSQKKTCPVEGTPLCKYNYHYTMSEHYKFVQPHAK